MTVRLIVAGSRSITDYAAVESAIISNFPHDSSPHMWDECEIVHGGADGVDSCASEFALNYCLPEHVFRPDWDEYGKAAGPIRNREMAEYGDMLIAIWDGESNGTRDMIEKALDEGIPVHVEVMNV